MQRLFFLALLTVVLGGGYAALQGLLPADVQRVVNQSGVLQQSSGGVPVYPGRPGPPYAAPLQQQPVQQQPVQQPPVQQPMVGPATPGYTPAASPPGSTIRIATFNIQIFGSTKASNPNVMRTLAAIVQQFDVVAIQEIRTKDDYLIDNFLRDYVNAAGRRYSRIVGPRLGRTPSTEQYAFVFDTATIQANPNLIYTINDTRDDLLHREPLVAMFATRAASPFTFILVNTHTDPDEADEEMTALAQVLEVVRRSGPGEDDVILLGDLNTNVPISLGPTGMPTRQLQPADLAGLGTVPGIYPVVYAEPTNTRRSRLHDNILINRGPTTEFTGRGGVYDFASQFGLSREQALSVSDHLPVWAEFSVVEGAVPGRTAFGVPSGGRR
ncbi:MAG: endonuclease/exonuclease/phosphatase family protein [Planctomycetota bacterium]